MRNDSEHVESVLRQALTVKELREALESYDDDARVVFVCDYGDYHHTQQALPVSDVEDAESMHLCKSAYSHSEIALNDDDGDELDDLDDEERKEYFAVRAEIEEASQSIVVLKF